MHVRTVDDADGVGRDQGRVDGKQQHSLRTNEFQLVNNRASLGSRIFPGAPNAPRFRNYKLGAHRQTEGVEAEGTCTMSKAGGGAAVDSDRTDRRRHVAPTRSTCPFNASRLTWIAGGWHRLDSISDEGGEVGLGRCQSAVHVDDWRWLDCVPRDVERWIDWNPKRPFGNEK